jgi:hypothetical protein
MGQDPDPDPDLTNLKSRIRTKIVRIRIVAISSKIYCTTWAASLLKPAHFHAVQALALGRG